MSKQDERALILLILLATISAAPIVASDSVGSLYTLFNFPREVSGQKPYKNLGTVSITGIIRQNDGRSILDECLMPDMNE